MPKADIPKKRPGRPRGALGKIAEERKMTVRELSMKHVRTAIQTWVDIMNDKTATPTARIAAAESLMNRAVGRPAQAEPTQADTPDKAITGIKIEFAEAPKRTPAKKVKAPAK